MGVSAYADNRIRHIFTFFALFRYHFFKAFDRGENMRISPFDGAGMRRNTYAGVKNVRQNSTVHFKRKKFKKFLTIARKSCIIDIVRKFNNPRGVDYGRRKIRI